MPNQHHQLSPILHKLQEEREIGNNTGNPAGTDRLTRTLSCAGGIPCLPREGMPTGSQGTAWDRGNAVGS